MIKLLIGGSPCTYWSVAQRQNREVEAEGLGWELFRNYLIAKEKFNPDFFLYENNKSAAQSIKDQIGHELGAELMYINSSLVSAQNRERFYCFNWEVEQPKDRGIKLQHIIENGIAPTEKAHALTASYPGAVWWNTFERHQRTMIAVKRATGKHEIIGGYGEYKGRKIKVPLPDGRYDFRKFTSAEACRLQTLPDHYCDSVNKSAAQKHCGNGWTAEVIIHILNGALKDVPRDEEIIVLSMYDGIGTGRYCLDKMGFTNVTYYAYEIDESAIKVALSNFPDIIQMGDAFDLRSDDWKLGKHLKPEQHRLDILPEAPENKEPEKTTTHSNVVERLRNLIAERKALSEVHPDTDCFTKDAQAIEYAVNILQAMAV